MLKKASSATALPLHIDSVKRHLVIDHADDDILIESYIDSATQWVENHCERALVQQSWQHKQDSFCTKIKVCRLPMLAVDSIQYLDSDNVEQTVPEESYRVGLESGRVLLKNNSTWPSVPSAEEGISVNFQSGYLVPLTVEFGTNTLTATGLGFSDDQVIILSTNHTLPAGLSNKTPYFVINSTGSSFQLSLTQGGAAVEFTDSGTGDCFAGELSTAIQHALLLLIGHWYNSRENSMVGSVSHEIPMGVESLLQPYRVYA